MSLATACVKGVCVCLLPMETNRHRPYALRHSSLTFVSLLLLTIKIATVGLIALTPTQAELSTITVNRIIQLTNAERTKVGLSALATNNKLALAAAAKGADMLKHDYFAHISPTGVTPWFWMAQAGYTYEVAGENLAIDFSEAEDVVTAWIASPSHKDNMLRSDYTETGVAVVAGEFEGGTSTIVVHMFGRSPGSQVAAQTTASPTPTPVPTKQPAATKATPSPTPNPTLAPVASESPEPPVDTTPPRVPRISTPDGSTTVRDSVQLFIEGEELSTTHLLINDDPAANVPLSSQGKAIYSLGVKHVDEGDFTVKGYSSDGAQNISALSEPLALHKDTQAPEVAREEVSFFVSPVTELSEVVLHVPAAADFTVRLAQGETIARGLAGDFIHIPALQEALTVVVTDTAGNETSLSQFEIAPQFIFSADQEFVTPAKFAALGRQTTAYVLVTILILLMLTVFIRVRIQHPDLITHATFVIMLGLMMLML